MSLFSLTYLLTYSIFYFYQCELTFTFSYLGYNPMLLHFVAQIVSALASGSFFSWFLHPFDGHHHCVCFLWFFFSASILSGTIRHSRLILNISCRSSGTSHFSEEPWFLLLESCVRNQDLGAECVCLLLLGPWAHRATKYICTSTCVCTLFYKYFYMHLYPY